MRKYITLHPGSSFSLLLLALAVLVFPSSVPAGSLGGLEAEQVIGGLQGITAVTHAGDGRLFIVLKVGLVILYENGDVRNEPFLDITDRVRSGNERGLLSIAFHPNFPTNGRFFANYTNAAGDTVITRFTVSGGNPDQTDPNSEVVLLDIAQPFANHNGGQMQFGPDGFLYIATGDGGSGFDPLCQAQDGGSLLGKILRLDVDSGSGTAPFHSIPPSNPFVGDPEVRDEIWALGLRNPWRFSFDRATGDLFIADVGQDRREEIDFQPASSPGGQNYGWKRMEGTFCTDRTDGCGFELPPCDAPQYTPPVIEYDHGGGRCAVTGGYVYRGAAIPRLTGAYVYGDFCSGDVWAATRRGGIFQVESLDIRLRDLTTFGEDAAGELYIAAGPRLYRLMDPAGPDPDPQPGELAFTTAGASVAEDAGQATIFVERRSGDDGAVSVEYTTADDSAVAGVDYVAAAGTLEWADGDGEPKSLTVDILDNDVVDGDRRFSVRLSSPTGGATLAAPRSTTLTIENDDVDASSCVESPTGLCLANDRFEVRITWRTSRGENGVGRGGEFSGDTGWFYFFNRENIEAVIKVLDGCSVNGHFWVFAAGLTDVEATLTVRDSVSGEVKTYRNPLGEPFQPVQDTSAFATCP